MKINRWITAGLCVLLCLPVVTFSKEPRQLFIEHFQSCIDDGWLKCDDGFAGANRIQFNLFIESERFKKANKGLSEYFASGNGKSCESSEIINIGFRSTMLANLNPSKLFSPEVEMIENDDGSYYFNFPTGEKMALIPDGKTYKVAISDQMEKAYQNSEEYPYSLAMRITSSVINYHLMLAEHSGLSCVEFVSEFNEALAPIALIIFKDESDIEKLKPLVKRNVNQVASFYLQFENKEQMLTYISSQ